jgi:hypothetical protein
MCKITIDLGLAVWPKPSPVFASYKVSMKFCTLRHLLAPVADIGLLYRLSVLLTPWSYFGGELVRFGIKTCTAMHVSQTQHILEWTQFDCTW